MGTDPVQSTQQNFQLRSWPISNRDQKNRAESGLNKQVLQQKKKKGLECFKVYIVTNLKIKKNTHFYMCFVFQENPTKEMN